MAQPAGWYHAAGDPDGTHRYWNGERWITDARQSGWWALLLIVPGANVALLLATLVINGKPEANQWGVSPKYG